MKTNNKTMKLLETRIKEDLFNPHQEKMKRDKLKMKKHCGLTFKATFFHLIESRFKIKQLKMWKIAMTTLSKSMNSNKKKLFSIWFHVEWL